MGFFSARRSEDISEQFEQDATVVRVIRSRFYGKQSASKPRNAPADANTSRSSSSKHPSATHYDSSIQRPMDASIPSSSKSTLTSNFTSKAQSAADPITITLAQRLDELAVANSEGLLNDDEYRLLRQSLFDRFASGSTVPAEVPLVPVGMGSRNRESSGGSTSPLHNRRASSQYNASVKSPSLQSKRSISSTMSGIFRRATGRRKSSQAFDDRDSVSMFSSTSTSTTFPRLLSKQSSTVSLRTEYSLAAGESNSTRINRDFPNSHSVPASPSMSRSTTRSSRAAPPSSFSAKGISRESRHLPRNGSDDFAADEEQAQTAHDIRQEIEAIEAEFKRLLDAFNGLELSALVRIQRNPGSFGSKAPVPSSSSTDLGSRFRSGSVSMSPKGGSIRLPRDDSMSVRSGQSVQTMFSANRAPSIHNKSQRSQPAVTSPLGPGSLPRKNSVSSISIHSKKSGVANTPMSPSLSRSSSKFRLAMNSTSSVNLSRSANHLPLETVSETDTSQRAHSPTWSGNDSVSAMRVDAEGGQMSAEEEMADIQRRRAEVVGRYDARLEYLRARLRGAELREKLMRS
ncbi:hypothetical protein BXZ70DRAFT_921189 [Cristinia sonorae]|uniref:Uncharacterized protein n=1 Tax=Cristinia sonorae TaxID=1940300 RepID=A0A8K0UU52_9AGAR|nr:hypothetical protein BXZ70DRAFT_921189 [Cristinia sonorae]